MNCSSSERLAIFLTMLTVVLPAPALKELVVKDEVKPVLMGFPFSSQKEFLVEKLDLGWISIYSTKLKRATTFSGETMAYNQRPPSRKSISFVWTRHGLGPIHWSSISAFVKASQTRSRSA